MELLDRFKANVGDAQQFDAALQRELAALQVCAQGVGFRAAPKPSGVMPWVAGWDGGPSCCPVGQRTAAAWICMGLAGVGVLAGLHARALSQRARSEVWQQLQQSVALPVLEWWSAAPPKPCGARSADRPGQLASTTGLMDVVYQALELVLFVLRLAPSAQQSSCG